MPQYKAPLRDMNFVMNEVLDYPGHYAKLPCAENATPEFDNMLAIIRALNAADVTTAGDITFLFTVEEETSFKGVNQIAGEYNEVRLKPATALTLVRVSGVSTPAVEQPRNTSASFTASASVRPSVFCAYLAFDLS